MTVTSRFSASPATGLMKRHQAEQGALVADALADIAARDETIVPRCPFVTTYLGENTVEGLSVDWPHGAPGA